MDNLERTQTQMRIDRWVFTGEVKPEDTLYVDLGDYRGKPFIQSPEARRYLTEDEIKSGNYAEDALQARLAMISFEEEFNEIASRLKPDSWVSRAQFRRSIDSILKRNEEMRKRVERKYMKDVKWMETLINVGRLLGPVAEVYSEVPRINLSRT